MKMNFLTEEEIKQRYLNSDFKNGIMKALDIEVIGHFGNAVCVDAPICYYNDGVYVFPFNGIVSTLSCGILIKVIFDLFDIHEEDGIKLSKIKNIPCRIAFNDNKTIAVGNFIKNKFMIVDEFHDSFKKYISEIKFN